jgi:hypothetical protein
MTRPLLTSFDTSHFSPALADRLRYEIQILISYEMARSDQVLPTYSPGPARDDMLAWNAALHRLKHAVDTNLKVLPLEGLGSTTYLQVTDRIREAENDHAYGQKLLADLEK